MAERWTITLEADVPDASHLRGLEWLTAFAPFCCGKITGNFQQDDVLILTEDLRSFTGGEVVSAIDRKIECLYVNSTDFIMPQLAISISKGEKDKIWRINGSRINWPNLNFIIIKMISLMLKGERLRGRLQNAEELAFIAEDALAQRHIVTEPTTNNAREIQNEIRDGADTPGAVSSLRDEALSMQLLSDRITTLEVGQKQEMAEIKSILLSILENQPSKKNPTETHQIGEEESETQNDSNEAEHPQPRNRGLFYRFWG